MSRSRSGMVKRSVTGTSSCHFNLNKLIGWLSDIINIIESRSNLFYFIVDVFGNICCLCRNDFRFRFSPQDVAASEKSASQRCDKVYVRASLFIVQRQLAEKIRTGSHFDKGNRCRRNVKNKQERLDLDLIILIKLKFISLYERWLLFYYEVSKNINWVYLQFI